MNKPSRSFAKPLRDLLSKVVGETFTRRGFASAELVTRWTEIVGAEIAAHSEPMKIQWTRPADGEARQPGTLILRVEGPAAIEIQHLANVICERVNRFLGWRAVDRVALRQAPLRNALRQPVPAADPAAAADIAASMPEITDDELRQALARLGAAVRRS
ncbi:MAG TPA: DciA family protein [Xanthobacteraceae bacterium]|nr:DciA family protein [Xanthobacteraceae bacterium]